MLQPDSGDACLCARPNLERHDEPSCDPTDLASLPQQTALDHQRLNPNIQAVTGCGDPSVFSRPGFAGQAGLT